MAKDSGKKGKSSKKSTARERRERRFEPQAGTAPVLVYVLGALGAMAMGAGVWGQFGSMMREGGPEPLKFAPYILAAGALLVGAAIWLGTSGEAALRVGDAGIAIEKGGLRRMPWYAIEHIEWRDQAIRASGKDDMGGALSVVAKVAGHGAAAAWIVKEARQRIPGLVDVPEDVALPEARASAGESLALEPAQVVGKHCAASGKVIAYEPDARVCPRCERVYHKAHVPEACECGASLAGLQPEASAG
jgi:hypothetical protein